MAQALAPPPFAGPKISVEGLRHTYQSRDRQEVVALDDICFEVADREFVTVVGPSGCGKSTLVHLIAGLASAAAGTLLVDGKPVRGPGRDRGVVFQELALLPWRTVKSNIGHGPQIARVPRRERQEIVDRYVELVGLHGFADRYPHELSGGMKQRVAVARALAADPAVLLMDEPFAAVDAQTRITLQEELLRITAVTNKTVLFVTHSVEEAAILGDRVLVLTSRPGRIKRIVDVPIPRDERTWDSMPGNETFIAARDEVTKLVRDEVKEVRRVDAGLDH